MIQAMSTAKATMATRGTIRTAARGAIAPCRFAGFVTTTSEFDSNMIASLPFARLKVGRETGERIKDRRLRLWKGRVQTGRPRGNLGAGPPNSRIRGHESQIGPGFEK